MKKALRMFPLFAVVVALLAWPSFSQTPHGIALSWTAPTIASGEPAIAGYNIYRTVGSGSAVKLNTTAIIVGTTYLDPNSDLTAGQVYSYDVTTVDVNGNESGPSNVATITPAVLIVNPPAPSGCNAKQQ